MSSLIFAFLDTIGFTVLILICVEVSVWEIVNFQSNYGSGVLILICVEVSVWDTIEVTDLRMLLDNVLILICVEVSVWDLIIN